MRVPQDIAVRNPMFIPGVGIPNDVWVADWREYEAALIRAEKEAAGGEFFVDELMGEGGFETLSAYELQRLTIVEGPRSPLKIRLVA